MYCYVGRWLLLKTTTILYKTNIGRPTSSVSVIIKRYETGRTSYEKERRQQIVFFDGQQWSLCVCVCVWRLLFFLFCFDGFIYYIEADGARSQWPRRSGNCHRAAAVPHFFFSFIFCLTHTDRQSDTTIHYYYIDTTKQLKKTLDFLSCFVLFFKGGISHWK